ncbi:MAG: hypothetical protein ACI83B_003361 [Sediminicola sp.]|jgi:hypothetical protein
MLKWIVQALALHHHNRATVKALGFYRFVFGAEKPSYDNKQFLKISLPSNRRL